MSGALSQAAAITIINLRTLRQRGLSSLTTILGVGSVVLMLVALMSILQGLRVSFELASSGDAVLIVSQGSTNEFSSGFGQDAIPAIEDALAATLQRPAAAPISPELALIVELVLQDKGTRANGILRGVGRNATQVRDGFRLVAGRLPRPGTNEALVGVGAAHQYADMDIGDEPRAGRAVWRIVGRFAANGGSAESEIWADAAVVQSVYQRSGSYQSVRLRLPDADRFELLRQHLEANRIFMFSVEREREFQMRQWRTLRELVVGAIWLIACAMGAGAVVAALNTMQYALSCRTQEIATLRALGFGALPLMASVLCEALLLGLVGSVIAGGIAYLLLDGTHTSTLNWQTFTQVTFAFTITPLLALLSTGYGLLLTVLGAVPSSLTAVRGPVASALRE